MSTVTRFLIDGRLRDDGMFFIVGDLGLHVALREIVRWPTDRSANIFSKFIIFLFNQFYKSIDL